jgi:hypothetical protein
MGQSEATKRHHARLQACRAKRLNPHPPGLFF